MEPDAGEALEVAEQLSVGSGIVKFTTALHKPESLSTSISSGQIATGSSLSSTVTLNVHISVFPAASVTVTIIVSVTPTSITLPDAGTATVETTEQLSVDVGSV